MTILYALISRCAYARQEGRAWALAFQRPWPTTRRGLCLWLLGIAITTLGAVNYVGTELPDATRKSLSLPLTISDGNPLPWGLLMVAVGCFAVFASYCHFGRDRIGYVVVAMFCTGWGVCYLTGPLYGAGLRSVGGAAIWLIFAAFTTCVAGFPNVRIGNHPPIMEDAEDSE